MTQTNATLYQRYLVADRIVKACEVAGVDVARLSIVDYSQFDIEGQFNLIGDHSSEANERALVALWELFPQLELKRSSGLIFLDGEMNRGITVHLYFGSGACERVQVGTRTVPATPQRIIPATPEYEEPIFEVRCVDPINELVNA